MRIYVETKLLLGVVQYLMLPAKQVIDRFPTIVLADPITQHHARSTIAEQQHPYPNLLQLMYGLQLRPRQHARDLTSEDQNPRRLFLKGSPESKIGCRPERRETAGTADAVQQHLLHALVDAQLLDDVVVEAWVCGIRTCRRHDMCDLVQATAPLCDCFATGSYGECHSIFQENLAEVGDCGWFGFVDDGVVNGAD